MDRRQGAARIGKQPPRYRFFLNPYQDVRFTRCPICQRPTRQRKLPLVIHVDPMNEIVLNKTCRYCPNCDLLIAHQDELEAQLAEFFARQKPEVIGNDYLVLGTEDRADWQRGRKEALTVQDMVQALHDFKEVLRFEPAGGWGRGEPIHVGKQFSYHVISYGKGGWIADMTRLSGVWDVARPQRLHTKVRAQHRLCPNIYLSRRT